ncbi:unnamed protein product [Schistosoma margrebowiei]|uniref:Uncharacterized protein n=1 Tax=Schistosoma margrebowiei TaxID=48269 RepID=A0A183NB31_9TREM|nr:unnamed protein product [Schistosoma margrebowiei]
MMTFASVTSSLNKNPFIPILLDDRIYDLIMNTLINPQLRYYHGVTACRFLGLLLQYTEPDVSYLFILNVMNYSLMFRHVFFIWIVRKHLQFPSCLVFSSSILNWMVCFK